MAFTLPIETSLKIKIDHQGKLLQEVFNVTGYTQLDENSMTVDIECDNPSQLTKLVGKLLEVNLLYTCNTLEKDCCYNFSGCWLRDVSQSRNFINGVVTTLIFHYQDSYATKDINPVPVQLTAPIKKINLKDDDLGRAIGL